jgi:hypothetical protein
MGLIDSYCQQIYEALMPGFYWAPLLLLAFVTFVGAIAVLFLRTPRGFDDINIA